MIYMCDSQEKKVASTVLVHIYFFMLIWIPSVGIILQHKIESANDYVGDFVEYVIKYKEIICD